MKYEDFCLLFLISYVCITRFTVRSHCDLENSLYNLKGCNKFFYSSESPKTCDITASYLIFKIKYLFKITFINIYLKQYLSKIIFIFILFRDKFFFNLS